MLYQLYNRVTELMEQQRHSSEDKGRMEKVGLLDRLEGLTTESTAVKLEKKLEQQSTESCHSLDSEKGFTEC